VALLIETLSIQSLRSDLDRAIGLRDSIKSRLTYTKDEIKRLENEEALLLLVSELFRKLIDQEVTIGVQAVEKLQTEGLQAVFSDQDLSVKANIEVQRGKVSVDLITTQKHKNGMEIEGMSNDAFGGAVSTVQSVLLRVIIIMRRGLRPLLLLDETLPAFDNNYINNMGQFLSTLCKRLNMDILSVTHNPAVVDAADKAYRIVTKNGSAHFEVIR
jgi:hypothetical protein